MRASECILLTGALAAGCFNPIGSVDSEATSTEMSSGPEGSTSTSTGGSISTSLDEMNSSSSSSSVESCGDGQIQDGEECDGVEGCSAECTKEFRRVFVTSEVFTGNLGGIAGADQKCQTAAEKASLPGKYRAWISSPDGSPADQFTRSLVPYQQIDETVIASDWEDLVDGTLLAGIFLTELGGPPQKGATTSCMLDGAFVWSNTKETGDAWPDADHCGGWSSTIGKGFTGWAGQSDSSWTMACSADCIDQAALYCVEQ